MDNYLDGGYHVSFLHKDLASGLDINSYRLIFSGPFFKTMSLNLSINKIESTMILLNISLNTYNLFRSFQFFCSNHMFRKILTFTEQKLGTDFRCKKSKEIRIQIKVTGLQEIQFMHICILI